MGKASSAKKVQRAARAGGRVSAGQPRSLLFPGILALVVVLGVSLVVYAREDRRTDDLGGVPQLGDHIHQAFAVNACGEWLPNLPEWQSRVGIHTHGDGVLHIHPHSQLGVGTNATLDRFFADARDEAALDVSLSGSELVYQGETFEEGETECEGVEEPQLRMAYWPNVQDESSEPVITTGGFGDTRLTDDGGGITIFFGERGADIPRPPNSAQLAELGAADGPAQLDPENPEAGATTTTAPAEGDATTTTAPAEGDATTTTAPAEGDATTTTAAGETTSTTAAG